MSANYVHVVVDTLNCSAFSVDFKRYFRIVNNDFCFVMTGVLNGLMRILQVFCVVIKLVSHHAVYYLSDLCQVHDLRVQVRVQVPVV